ncbi:hypothetical protein B7463_g7627, partial [Scytalidium lignicola]
MRENRHAHVALSTWRRLKTPVNDSSSSSILIDGDSLSIAEVVAIARYGQEAKIDASPATTAKVDDSVNYLAKLLEEGHLFYGVRTGFGGSANTRSADTGGLQVALMQMQQCGVLSENQLRGKKPSKTYDPTNVTSMPEAWVRAATVVRCNTLVRGQSAVRYHIIQMLERLLNEDYVPLVPLRGSISASGDLSPLSYIAGVLEGNPNLSVWVGKEGTSRTLISADQALNKLQLNPVSFGPKEALGMINGTAVSAAVGALALHEVQQFAILSQILTAMGVEALHGNSESFHPFLAQVRPHRGQVEAAHNITGFLRGSRLVEKRVSSSKLEHSTALWQDRYPLRTSPQWMGPLLEDLVLAHQQITTELNSTTDNPVIDVKGSRVFHGGNFQAVAVTSAVEKARSALQMMGKMLFAQCTELMSPSMSNGLPPNLVYDEPSVDIAMAAYTSELGFLSHPVGPHVQSAEMANQAINSLALLSARYTHAAIDTFAMLAASYIYSLCQALDLRVMQVQLQKTIRTGLQILTGDVFASVLPPKCLEELQLKVQGHVAQQLGTTTSKDSTVRFQDIAESTQAIFMTFFTTSNHPVGLSTIAQWTAKASDLMLMHFKEVREVTVIDCETPAHLGLASKRVYKYVREKLKIPLNRGLVDHPSIKSNSLVNGNSEQRKATDMTGGEGELLVGDCVSRIYDSLRSGEMMHTIMECLEDVMTYEKRTNGMNGTVNH